MQTQNADLRERKRASDRESQRQSRARTKAYIAQLEEAVQAFRRDAAGLTSEKSPSAAQLMQLIEENQQLRAALGRVQRLTKSILGPSDQEANEDGKENQENGSPPEACQDDGKSTNGLHQPSPFVANSTLFDYSTWPGLFGAPDHPQTLPVDIQIPMPTMGPTQPASLPLMDSSLTPGIPENFFITLNSHFTQLEQSEPNAVYSGPEEDADIAIRAILNSWEDARTVHSFDTVWHGLELLDRCLFHRCRTEERTAMMHLLRALIIYKIGPVGQPQRRIAGFQKPTHFQRTLAHASIIDYFYWPDLRDVLVLSNANYATQFSANWFASYLRMNWPFRTEDMAKYNKATQRYSFSDEFERYIYDLNSWTSPFGDANSEVVVDVFKLNTVVEPQLMA